MALWYVTVHMMRDFIQSESPEAGIPIISISFKLLCGHWSLMYAYSGTDPALPHSDPLSFSHASKHFSVSVVVPVSVVTVVGTPVGLSCLAVGGVRLLVFGK